MKNGVFRKGVVVTPADFQDADWVRLLADHGLNTLGIHSGGGAAHDVVARLGKFAGAAFRAKVAEAGLDWEYELHAPHQLMDYALFATHPEYFPQSLRNRERIDTGNWCVSAPPVLPLVAENAARLAAELPSSTRRYFFWGTDVAGGDWCHCEGCSDWTASDQNLLTANAIARRLRRDDPAARVCALSYLSTLPAPRLVRPEPNVFAEFAPYQRCYEHALADGHCAVNRAHLRHLLELIEVFGAERIHVLEYWLDSSLFGFDSQPPHRIPCRSGIMRQDVAFYASLGIRSITTFAVRMDGAYFAAYGREEFTAYAEALAALD